MEGRDKCEFKINKPLKFLTGRADCISDDPEGRDYVTTKEEVSLFTFRAGSSKSELAKISELRIKKMCY